MGVSSVWLGIGVYFGWYMGKKGAYLGVGADLRMWVGMYVSGYGFEYTSR